MSKITYKKTYLREWREHRGLSLRKLAGMMNGPDDDELISFASIARIEAGNQPYSQPILEGVAAALGTSVDTLLTRAPGDDDVFSESHINDTITSIFTRIPRAQLNQYSPSEISRLVILCLKAFDAHRNDPKIIDTIIRLFQANENSPENLAENYDPIAGTK